MAFQDQLSLNKVRRMTELFNYFNGVLYLGLLMDVIFSLL